MMNEVLHTKKTNKTLKEF